METYLTEIKQLRIPRPKFEPNSCHQQHQHATATGAAAGTGTATVTPTPPHHHQLQLQHHHHHHHHHHAHHQWRHFVRPFTPPRDYHLPVVGGAVAWSAAEDSATHDKM
ncbi:forkhead box protein B2 [Drosophila novamexicana]|uniref:forkhead box protein B2 n=1 Tax=Drosophila novamexicana TaxID=47314 RepID=UPI0011E5EA53|nr:forkhead box protein B2 [Drosophila novamexicana]XP_030573148.1 forkhead box protein B2 [Drosophila novamexicana]